MLFGTDAPKMIVNLGITNDEVLLDYATIITDEPELYTDNIKAVRTGKRVYNYAGRHWIYKVRIHLWKYGSPTAKYASLKSYEGTKVKLYRHKDGLIMKDAKNNDAVFVLTSVNESYTDEYNLYDIVTLTFRSTEFIKTKLDIA